MCHEVGVVIQGMKEDKISQPEERGEDSDPDRILYLIWGEY